MALNRDDQPSIATLILIGVVVGAIACLIAVDRNKPDQAVNGVSAPTEQH